MTVRWSFLNCTVFEPALSVSLGSRPFTLPVYIHPINDINDI